MRAQSQYELVRSEEYAWVGSGLTLSVAAGLLVYHYRTPPPVTPDAGGINRFDRSLMQPYREDHLADALVMTSFTFPFTLLSRDDVREEQDVLALMWFEAALLNQGLVVASKAVVQRSRPYAYYPDAPAALREGRTSHFSFYSGHAAFSAMNSVFTAAVFSQYSSDRNTEVAMWAGVTAYTALTCFSRVNTGHHFPTDVITGAVIGATIGYLVPALHRSDAPDEGVTPASASRTLRIGASFSF